MATKLGRDAEVIAGKMRDLEQEIGVFSQRKLGTLPKGVAWTLLRATMGLISAASKVQLEAMKKHLKDTKDHFAETARP